MISASVALYIPNKILDFVIMLFGYHSVDPSLRTFIVGCIAFFMYVNLAGFVLSYIRKLLMGNDKRPTR